MIAQMTSRKSAEQTFTQHAELMDSGNRSRFNSFDLDPNTPFHKNSVNKHQNDINYLYP